MAEYQLAKIRILFVCIGNACRSPMAEGFARAYGSDVLVARSAGLAPALGVVPLSHQVMLEKNIDLGDCYPKHFAMVEGEIDLIVNMSGYKLPDVGLDAPVEVWDVSDPIGESEEVFRRVRDEIESRVKELIERLRSRKPPASEPVGVAPASVSNRTSKG